MLRKNRKHLLEAASTLIGFTIGAGILGIPFAVAKAGFLTGILNILVLGILILLLNLYLGEAVLRTKGSHQLTGYARIYLGKTGYYLMIIAFAVFSYGALIAYTLKIGELLNALLNPVFGGTSFAYSIIFFILSALIVYKGVRIVEKSEVLMVFFVIAAVITLTIFAAPKLNAANLTGFGMSSFFVPYGVVLFAFAAIPSIPIMNEELKNNKKELKKAVIIGSLIPLVVYILFALIVVGISGRGTTDDAILGMYTVLGTKILILGSIFGILTMATSFIAVSFALVEMYRFDYRLKNKLHSALACFSPVIFAAALISSNLKNAFFRILDATGTFGGSLEGILIVCIWWKAKKLGEREPEYSIKGRWVVSSILILMFVLGAAVRIKSFI